jgi:hypothetical protein
MPVKIGAAAPESSPAVRLDAEEGVASLSRRKGEITTRMDERDYLHLVELFWPLSGLVQCRISDRSRLVSRCRNQLQPMRRWRDRSNVRVES